MSVRKMMEGAQAYWHGFAVRDAELEARLTAKGVPNQRINRALNLLHVIYRRRQPKFEFGGSEA